MARAPFQVLVFPFRTMDGGKIHYALFRRSDLNCWQGIAGGGEDQETPLEAARREACEEAGICEDRPYVSLDSISSIPVVNFPGHSAWGEDVLVIPEYSFGVDATGVECRTSEEHSEMCWLPYRQAYDLLHWDSNRTALWELHQRMQRGTK